MLMLLIGLAGCNQDTLIEPSDDTVTLRTPEDLPMVPYHGEFVQTVDLTGGFLECLPEGFDLPLFPRLFTVEGKATHLGKIQGGTLEILNCTLDPSTGILGGDIAGTLIAANGDMIHFYGFAQAFPDGSGGSECTFDGGSGRWENACGYFTTQSSGQPDGMSMLVIADGEICAPGHIK